MKQKLRSIILEILSATVGNTLVFLFPKKAKNLEQKGMTLVMNNNLSISERLMRNAILKKVESKADDETLAALHENFWKNQGSEFFESNQDSFEKNFLPDCSFIFDFLEAELKTNSNEYTTIVEIGTGNGSVLEYLSVKFPKVENFVGVDLSTTQVKMNNEKFKENKNFEFIAMDGFEWVKTKGKSNTIFVTSRGVLEYFTQERLELFLVEINNLGNTMFVAIEPKGAEHDYSINPNSQTYGHERSFSHNYPLIFKKAGFQLWHESYKTFDNQSAIECFIGAKS